MKLNWSTAAPPYDWAVRFNEHVRGCLTEREHGALISYALLDQDASLSVPTPDHYLPLLYAARLHDDHEPLTFAVDGIEYGSIGMLTVLFGNAS